ncbi:hypothetical protein F511_45005 [Dorcoceras hygrometricum]|uniref:RRM domain-containing protein n=1 Tax=Dorcoceras hygrometricum TaxID=472368 RepID=A0A2Z7A4D6_9LAMI|nr:hypothetical protein F511_45005 [Dorcoceras hygrometricum]
MGGRKDPTRHNGINNSTPSSTPRQATPSPAYGVNRGNDDRLNEVAGDGTTYATVLTQAIFAEGCKLVAASMNAMDLRRGISMAVDAVVTNLKNRARIISTSEEIAQVGTISANGEREIALKESEVEDLFYKYGRILDIELKIPPRTPCYSFVEFQSCHGRCADGGRYGIPRHSDYRVVVRGFPSSASWQDLKDHMRKAGDVCFAEVYRYSEGAYGLVDYTNYEDMKHAIRKLDDKEFKNPWTRTYISPYFVTNQKNHKWKDVTAFRPVSRIQNWGQGRF